MYVCMLKQSRTEHDFALHLLTGILLNLYLKRGNAKPLDQNYAGVRLLFCQSVGCGSCCIHMSVNGTVNNDLLTNSDFGFMPSNRTSAVCET